MPQKVIRFSAKGLANAIANYGPTYVVTSRTNPTRSFFGFPVGVWRATLEQKPEAAIMTLSGHHRLPNGRGSFAGFPGTSSEFDSPIDKF